MMGDSYLLFYSRAIKRKNKILYYCSFIQNILTNIKTFKFNFNFNLYTLLKK